MKRKVLMRRLAEHARARDKELLVAEGRSHTKVSIGDLRSVAPRHREINELTAKAILKQMGVPV